MSLFRSLLLLAMYFHALIAAFQKSKSKVKIDALYYLYWTEFGKFLTKTGK